MGTQNLDGVRVAIIATDGFEQAELTEPLKFLRESGAKVEVVSLRPGSIQGMQHLEQGDKIDVDRLIEAVDPEDYDALVLPGGLANPDTLRQSDDVLQFVKEFNSLGKPIAAICHGPWVLISAGIVRGRRLTSWPGIQDDIRNAGGMWEDKAVVANGNWITSRHPGDIPQFNEAMAELFTPGKAPHDRRSAMPVGRLVAGGLAVAAASAVTYAVLHKE
jgi:protease I